ncbi:restriction endonuclease [Pseudaestuariivita sp.]|uniref:restriction endonuclease n=1 Tax=Pseudaestuariivita sp. TaxID=2211669 RepID=UPI004059CE65
MPHPSYQELMLPVLKLMASGHQTIPQCLPKLIAEFGLSSEEADELLPSGRQTIMANRAHWARNYMSQAGLVFPLKRGHYVLSDAGRDLLARNPEKIDNAMLRAYPDFLEFLDRSKVSSSSEDTSFGLTTTPSDTEASTPEDVISQQVSQLDRVLQDELLTAVLALSPLRFEQLIVDLLLKMGFGGGDASSGLRIGRSGDGGIDGIINEDALGLDAVYVQAKRYDPSNKVGRPDIQRFVGSLTGESATKGVFVTTSDYSREARNYISRVQQRIVLINGNRLAQLMAQHEVGVRARKTYVLKSVDDDYFTPDA